MDYLDKSELISVLKNGLFAIIRDYNDFFQKRISNKT